MGRGFSRFFFGGGGWIQRVDSGFLKEKQQSENETLAKRVPGYPILSMGLVYLIYLHLP